MAYIPQRGDVMWNVLDPRIGREQSGHRPALVLTPAKFNRTVKLAICCPITSRAQRTELEVTLPDGLGVKGVVLVYQVRAVDWRARGTRFLTKVPDDIIENVLLMLDSILDIPKLD